MFDDIELPWKPFGLTLTHGDLSELISWYISGYNDPIYKYGRDLFVDLGER